MNNQFFLDTALRQSAADLCCSTEDFFRGENILVRSQPSDGARRYLKLPFVCNLVYYGGNVVASVGDPAHDELVRQYMESDEPLRLFETPRLNRLAAAFAPYGMSPCFMAEYFLPDANALRPLPCEYETKVLEHDDFAELYVPEWSNALCADRSELDVLGVGAYDGGRLIGLAACSADCDTMWQIGIDVLPEYRRRGIASALTSRLALEIIERGRVPFYCAAWSNIPSVRNAISSGLRPAWIELTVKPDSFIKNMLR